MMYGRSWEIGGGGAVAAFVVVHWISRIINVRLEDAADLVDLFQSLFGQPQRPIDGPLIR